MSELNGKILIVDDDIVLRDRLGRTFLRKNFEVKMASGLNEAKVLLKDYIPDYALLDLKMGDGYGLDLVEDLRAVNPEMRIVVLTGYGNIASAVSAIRQGAVDYLAKPADSETIERALLNNNDDKVTDKAAEVISFPMSVDRVRWEHIHRVFEETGHNVSETARRLQMHRRTLQRILSKHAPYT